MSHNGLKRRCMRDQIRDVLVARILDGTYPSGTQLKELVLAQEFRVSQAPIREALRELEGAGLVASERYRGTRVRGADYRDMRESYELRLLIEVSAVERAMPYPAALLESLGLHLAAMAAGLRAGDPERYIDGALRFHRELVAGCDNRAFLAIWDSLLWDIRGRIALRRFTATGRSLAPLLTLHRTLFARLRAGDTVTATAALRHIFARLVAAFEDAPVPRACRPERAGQNGPVRTGS